MPVAPDPPGERAAVLLVDDSPEKMLALESALGGLPITIVKAASGREALRRLLLDDFAVILLDVRMPVMDGFETAALIRQRPRSEHTPIIFVTAVGDDVHVARGYSLKAVDYLLTPVVGEVLRTKVRVFVDLFRAATEVRRQAVSLADRARQLHQLTVASLHINAARSIDKILSATTASARDIFAAERAAVRARIDDIPHHGVAGTPGTAHDAEREAAVAGIIAATRRPFRQPPDGESGPLLGAPLTGRDGRHFGTLQVAGEAQTRFTAEDEDLLVQLAHTTSIAIENTLFGEAREANRMKDEFVATVSHELRTPLNAILSWAWMLRRGAVDETTVTRAAEAIERSVKTQVRIVDDLLDISRITTGKLRLDLHPVRLGPLIESALEAATTAGDAKDIRIVTALDPTVGPVLGDAHRLHQVIWNLVSNAIKFTPRGGRVDVELLRAGTDVLVRVSDTGRGIAPAFLPHVFEPFRQAEGGAARRTGGLGLGLAIVRQLVERHGGRVEVESGGEGQGATFTVVLPAGDARDTAPLPGLPACAPDALPPADGGTALAHRRVLIVEDDPGTQEALALIVSHAGGVVRAVCTADEARAVLTVWRPHVILCDIGLPGEDGYAFLRTVRALPDDAGGTTPAVAFTAYAQAADHLRALEAGFETHVPKPIDPERLIGVLAHVVARSGNGNGAAHAAGTPGPGSAP